MDGIKFCLLLLWEKVAPEAPAPDNHWHKAFRSFLNLPAGVVKAKQCNLR